MKLHFQPVTEETAPRILALHVKEEQEGFIETTEQCLEEAEGLPRWRPVGIYDGDRLIGFAMYGFWPEEGEQGRVWLDRFLIHASFQGKGYGKAVLPLLLQKIFQEYHGREIYLSLHPENQAALRLYEQAGFRRNGEVDPKGELVMVLAKPVP